MAKGKQKKVVRLKGSTGKERDAKINSVKKRWWTKRENLLNVFAGTTLILISSWIFMPSSLVVTQKFEAGDIVFENIYSPRDILAKDIKGTDKNREAAYNSVPDVYDYNLAPLKEVYSRVDDAFNTMREGYMAKSPDAYRYVSAELEESELLRFDDSPQTIEKRKKYSDSLSSYEKTKIFKKQEKAFYQKLGIEYTEETGKVLRWHHYRPQIAEYIKNILSEVWLRGVVENNNLLKGSTGNGIVIAAAKGDGNDVKETEKAISSLRIDEVYGLKEARSQIRQKALSLVSRNHPSLRREVIKICETLLKPNLLYNEEKTAVARKKAIESVLPVSTVLKKGELIVRSGERISEEQVLKLNAVRGGLGKGRKAQSAAGTILFITLIIISSWYYLHYYLPEIGRNSYNLLLLALIFIGQASILKMSSLAASTFALQKSEVVFSSYLFAAPFALAPLLVAIFFNRELTVLMTLLVALSTGLMFTSSNVYFWVALAGGLTALTQVGMIKIRNDIWRAGLHLVGANIVVIFTGDLLENNLFTEQNIYNLLFGSLGGFMVVALALTVLPLIERYFPVVSDLKLLELSDLNHPLLSRMAVVAPGTYHHSIVVGNLAEDAAEAVGANPLLVRVGAYFHDIGKMERPDYYIENQKEGKNRHDNLNPSMSSLIIVSHVTDGMELAKKYKLIPQVRDMIIEHHGTQTIKYFYQRAKDMEQPQVSAVKEQDFKYPGRKPTSRESAILALADSVEAATRSLQNPNSARVRQVVYKIIQDRFLEGELDESQLNLRDLKKIGNSFVRILHGIFHYRVKYPEGKEAGENNGNSKNWIDQAEHIEDKGEVTDNLG